jgi:hypothetical protein
MTEPLGPVRTPGAVGVAPAAPVAELLSAPPALQTATNFMATVLERSPDGAVMLRSAFGNLSLKTTQTLAPGTRVELRIMPGNPPSVSIIAAAEPDATDSAPPMQLDLGTTLMATVVAAAPDADAPAAGSRLMLRVGSAVPGPGAALLAGTIASGATDETVIDSAIGTLSLDRRLALPPGTALAFERLGALAPGSAGAPPTQASGWPALDQVLAVLDKSAPELAQQMRGELGPFTAPALAGTLLFLVGALYAGRWPGEPVNRALAAAGQGRLGIKLGDDVAELGRLSKSGATGEWQVLTLPLLAGAQVQPVRLFLRRGGASHQAEGQGARFVIETEMSRLGALQLDGMVRGTRLDLVLRSHIPLALELRQEATEIFHRASAAQGFHGDILFATAAEFAVAPLARLRGHVEVRI